MKAEVNHISRKQSFIIALSHFMRKGFLWAGAEANEGRLPGITKVDRQRGHLQNDKNQSLKRFCKNAVAWIGNTFNLIINYIKRDVKSGFVLLYTVPLLAGCVGSASIIRGSDDGSLTYQVFYDNLSPYGTWIDYPEYGQVWSPHITGDFRPYATNGHWVFCTQGWAWASGYSWGWATFHYGYWLYDDLYGWLWIPGYEWSPAWVTWGYFDDYYCWAPLMPGLFLGAGYGSWRPHSFYWNACRRDRIYDRHPVIERPQATNLDRISIINNFGSTSSHHLFYSKGPDATEVQQYVHQKVEPVTIRDVNRINSSKQDGNTMKVYRPALQDPVETMQQHPQQVSPPREFRKAERSISLPIKNENQQPARQPVEQRANIERLPVQRRGR